MEVFLQRLGGPSGGWVPRREHSCWVSQVRFSALSTMTGPSPGAPPSTACSQVEPHSCCWTGNQLSPRGRAAACATRRPRRRRRAQVCCSFAAPWIALKECDGALRAARRPPCSAPNARGRGASEQRRASFLKIFLTTFCLLLFWTRSPCSSTRWALTSISSSLSRPSYRLGARHPLVPWCSTLRSNASFLYSLYI